ncbi:MAG: small multi-drug export protein [Oscillospiraceae bacterium]|nr:small multi-drug export protein [Oscillospiraceae bacterium]
MAQSVTEFLIEYISPELTVFLISLLPVLELRGGMVAASLLGLPWQSAALLCLMGTLLPVPFILLFIRRILDWMSRTGPLRHTAAYVIKKAHAKGDGMMRRYPSRIKWALFLFSALPLPGTGAWSGALAASFLNLPPEASIPPIAMGTAVSCAVMAALAYGLPILSHI